MFPKEQSLTDIVKSFPQKKDMTDKPSRKIDLSGFLYLSDNILYKIRELTEKSSKEVSFKEVTSKEVITKKYDKQYWYAVLYYYIELESFLLCILYSKE